MSRQNKFVISIFATLTLLLVIFTHHSNAYQEYRHVQHPLFPSSSIDPFLENSYSPVIGIEIGETSRVGFLNESVFTLIPNSEGQTSIPSCFDGSCIIRPEHNFDVAIHLYKTLRNTAEQYFDAKVIFAVVNAPAYFNDTQRQSLKDAASIAGLNILRIVNEPVAAGLAYRLDEVIDHNVLIFNLNERTFDVAVESADRRLLDILAVATGPIGWREFEDQGLQDSWEDRDMIQWMFDNKMKDDINKARKEARLVDEGMELDSIILTGNPKYTAIISPLIESYLRKKVMDDPEITTDEAVIRGLAYQASVLSGFEGTSDCPPLPEVLPLSLGIDVGGVFMKVVPRNTVIPTRRKVTVTTVEDNQKWINIDIVEGERLISNKNKLLGILNIPIPPAPAGSPKFEIGFEIDADGNLKVKAEDVGLNDAEEAHGDGRVGTDINVLVVPSPQYPDARRQLLIDNWKQKLVDISYEKVDHMVQEAESNYEIDLLEKDAIIAEDLKPEFRVIEHVWPQVKSERSDMRLDRMWDR